MCCCVPFCNSRHFRGSVIGFHEFPVDVELRNKWLIAIARKDFRPKGRSTVCSLHFKETDFRVNKKIRLLKKGAVPSIFSGYPISLSQRSRDVQASENKNESREVIVACNTKKSPSPTKNVSPNLKKQLMKSSCTSSLTMKQSFNRKEKQHKKIRISSTNKVTKQLSINSIALNSLPLDALKSMETQSQYPFINLADKGKEKKEKCEEKAIQVDTTSNTLVDQQARLNSLESEVIHLNEIIDLLENKLKEEQQKFKFLESNSMVKTVQKMQMIYNAGLANKHIEFMLHQLEAYNQKSPRFPDCVLRECALLQACFPKGYDAVRDSGLVTLPSQSVMRRFIRLANSSDGNYQVDAVDSEEQQNVDEDAETKP